MRRYDVFSNPNPHSARTVPFLVVLQSEFLEGLATRVVAPLVKAASLEGKPAARLNPSFEIEGQTVFLLIQQIGAVPTRSLSKRVGSLEAQAGVIIGAIDFLLSGI